MPSFFGGVGSGAGSPNQISMLNGAGGVFNVWNLVLNQSTANAILMRSPTNILNDLTIGRYVDRPEAEEPGPFLVRRLRTRATD